MNRAQSEAVSAVFHLLKTRAINPSGTFDRAGRWYPIAANSDLVDHLRAPSRAWPYSLMAGCRTRKFVAAIAARSGVETVAGLRALV